MFYREIRKVKELMSFFPGESISPIDMKFKEIL